MKHAVCTGCTAPVLELDGQFEHLRPDEIQNGELPPDQTGWWHTACLVASPHGASCAAARLRTYRDVRHYAVIGSPTGWTVLQHARGDRVAIAATGETIELARLGTKKKKARKVTGGRVFPRIDEGYNLDVKDPSVVTAIRKGFEEAGSFPLLSVFELLGARDRVWHEVALERAIVAGVRESAGRHFITMRIEYGVFVPDALMPFTGAPTVG